MAAEFVVITPAWRGVEGETQFALWRSRAAGIPFEWYPVIGDALIGRSRSIGCTRFLENFPVDYMVFLDSDIVFEPQQLGKLFLDMRDGGHELIGGIYTVRGGKNLAHYGVDGRLIVDGTIREVAYLSTGFMGIAKSLLKRIVEELKLPVCHPNSEQFRCYPFFENTAVEFNGNWIYESEDWDFCRKARKVGAIPMCDTSILLGHKGDKIWTFADQPESVCRKLEKSELEKKGIWLPDHTREASRPGGKNVALAKNGKRRKR